LLDALFGDESEQAGEDYVNLVAIEKFQRVLSEKFGGGLSVSGGLLRPDTLVE
jgi:hypothetical protein